MLRHFRVFSYADQMTMFGFSIWPIPEYFGVGFSIALFYIRFNLYFSPRKWPSYQEEIAEYERISKAMKS